MDAKAYLSEIKKYNRLIEGKLDEIDRLRSLSIKTSATISAAPVHGGESDRLGALISVIADKETELKELMAEYISERDKRIALIEQLDDPTEYAVLYMRYVQGRKFEDIALSECFSEQWIYKKHKSALIKIQKKLNR